MSSRQNYSYMSYDNINPFLCCSICRNPFVDPVTASDNRRGCRSCFSDYSLTLTPITEIIVLEMLNGLLVKCLQCGDINIKRGEFKQHELNSCKQAVIPCTSADIKCSWKGPRASLDSHLEECVFEPLRPALSEIIKENKEYQERITKLENLVKQLKEEL